MKKSVIAIVILIILSVGIFAWQQSSEPSSTQSENSITTIQQEVSSGAILLDVRTPEEFATGHAAGAINIPLQQLQEGNFGQLNSDQKIFVYCRSGNRSAQAIQVLNQAGYTNTVDLVSLSNWEQLGGEITAD